MTDPYEPTTTYSEPGYPQAPETTHDVPPGNRPSAPLRDLHPAQDQDRVAPDIKPEHPRRHPVAYAALALSLIALLWLALTSNDGNSYQKVRVGTQDCVSVPQDAGPAALYCRTTGEPTTR